MGEYILFWVLIGAIALYTIIPDLLLHYLGIGAWKRQYSSGVALTFDDGPNPEITPQILDILARHQINATFFVVGKKAARYPDLIKLIQSHGHQLGAHSHNHRFAWFTSPWRTWRDWEECTSTLEKLTGEKVKWVRPPWGTFNLCTWLWIKIRHKQAVLWNAEGHDWLQRQNPQNIASRVLKQINDGSIILLHDDGGDVGAPLNTLKALDILAHKVVEEKKLPFVNLDFPRWSAARIIIFSVWNKWENVFSRFYKVERISSTNIFRLSQKLYRGPDLYSPSGDLLARNGDMVGEIHFDSLRLQDGENSLSKKGIHILSRVKQSLKVLAAYVERNPQYEGIQVFIGLTLINQGAKNLGFQVKEMPPTKTIRAVGLFQKLIMLIYNSSKKTSMKKYRGNQPKLVWISRQQLMEMWLPEPHEMPPSLLG